MVGKRIESFIARYDLLPVFCVQVSTVPLWEGIRDNNVSGCTLLLAAVPLLHLGTGCSGWRPSLREYMAHGFTLKTAQLAFLGLSSINHLCCVCR